MLSSGGHIGAAAASGAAQHVNLAAVRILKLEPAAVEVEAPAGLWLPRVGRLAGPSPGGGAAAVAALSRDTFRLDLDAGTASLRSLRANLLRLFVGDDPSAPPPPPPPGRPPPPGLAPERGCPRLRALLVEGARPAFLPEAEGLEAALSARGAPAGLLEELGALNGDQRRAVALCLRARDYAVVVGFPGTGKSETLALLARLLAATGKRVLLTAYTHAAVDSLVRKAAAPGGADGRVLRVGAPGAVAPDNRRFLLNGDGACGSTRALRERLGAASVVGATALAASSHPLLGGAPAGARPPFDVAIVDEAGQALLPAVLGPLRLARAFVLCGDHYQLPPIVREREARDRGLARSLLRRLCTEQPAACARLALQYRMCEPVMACANALVYGGQLKCAAPRVAAQRLRRAAGAAGLPPWLRRAAEPEEPLGLVDMDAAAAGGGGRGGAGADLWDEGEARVVCGVVRALLAQAEGLDEGGVGVICPYRRQVQLLRRLLAANGCGGVDVDTVDRFQGRDKEAVVLSIVRRNADRNVGSLLRDWRRINVAVTRAKKKLVVVGSRDVMLGAPLMAEMRAYLERNGAVVPAGDAAGLVAEPAAAGL